ncbi:MAG TPA: beta-ketoacyl-ACP synthase II [Thermodesulfobacteriota bacterium]|nr:beta-ketoacyl-ACP synthase II [Thermodesulfobacteriota bacterium]
MKRRVAVTGIGLVTPLGTGNKKTWEGICEGRSGIGRITKFDPSSLKTQIAGEVLDFEPEAFMESKEIRRSDPFIQYAVAATKLALDDANLQVTDELSPQIGTIIGSGIGGMDTYYKTVLVMEERGPSRISPFFVPNIIANMAAGYVSIYFNAKGPNSCTTTACAAGAHAIAYSAMAIQRGDADAMIAGGTEAPVIPMTIAGFNVMRAISTRNDEPERASRPFDRDRDGFIIAEGAGILILEELEFAKKRGARIYAELIGSGMSSDAYHITSPSLDGPVRCMKAALRDAELNPEDVQYINAHGTSTPQNDINETRAIKELFGKHAYSIPVSSTKSMTGHLLGAAGGIEAAFTALAIYHGILPPTINLDNPEPDCDLDYVANKAREADIAVALSNSFGFGGTNVTLAFRRFDGQ